MKPSIFFVFLLLLPMTGCLTTRQTAEDMRREEERRRQVLERERMLAEEERRRAMMMQTEEVEVQVQTLRQDMNRLRTEIAQQQSRDQQALEQRMARMEASLRDLEQRRQQDREEIINILTQRMTELMRQQQAASPTASGRRYTVVQGDTLSAIGAAFGVSAQAIMRANNMSSDRLRVGQTLVIP